MNPETCFTSNSDRVSHGGHLTLQIDETFCEGYERGCALSTLLNFSYMYMYFLGVLEEIWHFLRGKETLHCLLGGYHASTLIITYSWGFILILMPTKGDVVWISKGMAVLILAQVMTT